MMMMMIVPPQLGNKKHQEQVNAVTYFMTVTYISITIRSSTMCLSVGAQVDFKCHHLSDVLLSLHALHDQTGNLVTGNCESDLWGKGIEYVDAI